MGKPKIWLEIHVDWGKLRVNSDKMMLAIHESVIDEFVLIIAEVNVFENDVMMKVVQL